MMKDLLYYENKDERRNINKELSTEIIDEFEELLNDKNISVPDKNREWTEDEARIFGETYNNLESRVTSVLDDYLIRKNEEDVKIEHFRSKADMYIFALLYLEGTAQKNILKINGLLYSSNNLALQWRNKIYNILINYQGIINKSEALSKLDELYFDMIK